MSKTKRATRTKCPRCGGAIPSEKFEGQFPGALSRRDNRTEICSGCGTAEAFEDAFIIPKYTGKKYWKTR